jgi:signal transduction histidine kinase
MVPAVIGFALGAAIVAIAACVLSVRGKERARTAARIESENAQAALLGQLASGLAHEIRNPLSTLSMNLQLLREDWSNPVSEREQRGAKKIDVILRETLRLDRILEDLLRFSAGHKLRLERVQVNTVVDELLDFFTPQAEQAKVRLARTLAPSLPGAEADTNLLRQVVLNLLVNALQAMPSGGQLAVSTSAGDGRVRIVVADTGPGIPPENLEKIFNLYYSTKPGGTGLGLPMAKKIIDEHRGSLTVASVVGQGTTFTISLPALDAHR